MYPPHNFTFIVHGHYISDPIHMNRGVAQGQVGSDVVFTTQQLALSPDPKIFRTIYMDDLNDIVLDADDSDSEVRIEKPM